MRPFLFAAVAACALLVAADSASAHGGSRVVFVPDGFGGVRAVRVGDFHHVDPRFVAPRFVAPRFVAPRFVAPPRFHNATPFNQDGGPNRIGRRR